MNWARKYERTDFVNNSAPAINEPNLDNIEEELVELHERSEYLYKGIVNVDDVFKAAESLNKEINEKKTWVNTIVAAKDTAVTAANNANASATTSTQQANLAKTYSTAAKTSENNALASQKAAEKAADEAEQSAILATQKAGEASASAEVAAEQAEIAKEQAEIAKEHRIDAGISADRAEQALSQINEVVDTNVASFTLNLETGHMEYTGGRFAFMLNTDTGHLEWEVAV